MMTSSKLSEAFDFAYSTHQAQNWKNSSRPFFHHPLAVASLVLFYGGDDSQTQAALLHDAVNENTDWDELAKRFGSEVVALMRAFEDPPEVSLQKLDWAQGKRAYIKKIESLSTRAVFVIACEELHELSALLHDAKYLGLKAWETYPVPPRDLGWYYKTLATTFYKKLSEEKYSSLVSEFASQTKTLANRVFEGISD